MIRPSSVLLFGLTALFLIAGCDGLFANLESLEFEDHLDVGPDRDADADVGPNSCGEELLLCSGECVTEESFLDDPANCGACKEACDASEDCVSGRCEVACTPERERFGGGDGTAESPYTICALAHLAYLDRFIAEEVEDWGQGVFFELRRDLIASDGFSIRIPQFNGHLDGRGHQLSSLHNDSSRKELGLFGRLGGRVINLTITEARLTSTQDQVGALAAVLEDGGLIDNVTVKDSRIIGDSQVGGLVGHVHSGGQITNSFASNVNVQASRDLGGLVGFNRGSLSEVGVSAVLSADRDWNAVGLLVGANEGTVEDASAQGEIDGRDSHVERAGGLVGVNFAEGSIQRSSAAVSIGVPGDYVGGLVGSNQGSVLESFSSGAVVAGSIAGGLIGHQSRSSEVIDSYSTAAVFASIAGGLIGVLEDGRVARAYAAGEVGGEVIGGAFGVLHTGAVSALFWDHFANPDLPDVGDFDDYLGDHIQALTADEFSDVDAFPGWDFDTVWRVGVAPDNQTRPILRWQD